MTTPGHLAPGARLGQFEIIAPIGEGGMGTVYRARDSRLGREVALKLVRSSSTPSADSLSRLKREAFLLASLNHPNLATLYDADEADGLRYLVLELVPGSTLAESLAERRFPFDEALRIAGQIAAALESAHERAVVHRDLKPGNVKLTPSGNVKVLDFGLATLVRSELSEESLGQFPTMTADATREGTLLGTPAYMSPEQARGQAVDRRADIWAFGCVLFELLTGRSAFARATVADTLSAVLGAEPPWEALPDEVPAGVRRLLRRCLAKEHDRRLRDFGDARLEIEDALAPGAAPEAPAGDAASPRARWPVLAAALAGLVAGAGIALWSARPPAALPRPVARFAIPLTETARLRATDFPALAVSPDGTRIVFVGSRGGGSQLFVRPLAALEASPLPGTERATSPFFSPRGDAIGFFAGGKLKKVGTDGGPVEAICDAPAGFGGSWGVDDEIVFSPSSGSGLWRVSSDGGAPSPITELDQGAGEFSHRWPEIVNAGRSVLFTVGAIGSWDEAAIVAVPMAGGARRVLVRGGSHPRHLSSGHLLYVRQGALWAVPFDASKLELRGTPQRVVHDVRVSFDGAGQYAVAASGTLVYVRGELGKRMVWVDRRGAVEPLAAPAGAYSEPRLSPDGRSIVLTTDPDEPNLWLYEIGQQAFRQLTFEGRNWAPLWTPDGSRVVYTSTRTGSPSLFWRGPGSGDSEVRLGSGGQQQVALSWLAAGRRLLLAEQGQQTGRDLWTLELDGERRKELILGSPANEGAAAASPDGRWIAYATDATGRSEIHITAATEPTQSWQLSADGGTEPVWAADGSELFFRSADRMIAVAPSPGTGPKSWLRTELFRGSFEKGVGGRPNYDVSHDGARFLLIQGADPRAASAELFVVLEWAAELERLVPAMP